MAILFSNREEYLTIALQQIEVDIFSRHNLKLPEKFKIAVGFPPRSRGGKVMGVCISPLASANGCTEMFVNPTIGDAALAVGVSIHEAIHAIVGVEAGHGRKFKHAAKLVGLEGKAKACLPGPTLSAYIIETLLPMLGDYPHSAIDLNGGPKKQTTRMIKLIDPEHPEYSIRTTRKVIAMGVPVSPFGNEMIEAEND